jgi:hypothetical protein
MARDYTLGHMLNGRPAMVFFTVIAGALAVFAVSEAVVLWGILDGQHAIGLDFKFFRDIARTWVDTGQFYLERQLTGPYEVETLVDVLYPPIALYLFVPFLWLPAVLWWAIPIAVFCFSIAWLRPARWAWPLILTGIAWPQTVSQVLYGNTNMWVAAFIAAGVCFAWPSVLVLIKPSLAPFALFGVRRRRWWVALGVLVVVSIPFGTLWISYATAMRNSSLGLTHALITIPLMLSPVWAWLARGRRDRPRPLEADPVSKAVPDVNDRAPLEVQ